jgi:hypothetical protein
LLLKSPAATASGAGGNPKTLKQSASLNTGSSGKLKSGSNRKMYVLCAFLLNNGVVGYWAGWD